MNITVYPESRDWLLDDQRRDDHKCVWNFGLNRPRVQIGDDLLFRFDQRPIGRAMCRAIYKPGEFDCEMFNDTRTLTGWKVLWYQGDFEDLRDLNLPRHFGKLTTVQQSALAWLAERDGMASYEQTPAYRMAVWYALIAKKLVKWTGVWLSLTPEGWRAATREMSEVRRYDVAHVRDDAVRQLRADLQQHGYDVAQLPEDAGVQWAGGGPCCRICGCTEGHGCDERCEWVEMQLCSVCAERIGAMATA